ncbi:uncharacterized protein [Rutidosis leptorrhynchoides]|uniref:uncharacterized protein n=1 Tax=Rutidosis leptorrhynchoides TaxID=125765 RepID=UPI003A991099
MELALQTKYKLDFINGTLEKNEEDEVLSNQWERCNAVVLSWILGCVSDELYYGQIYSKLASVVWEELRETYDKVDGSVLFNLEQKISLLTQNGTPVSDYYHKLNSLWEQYDILCKLPSCQCDADKKRIEYYNQRKLMKFLMGLDDSYQPVRTTILTSDPLPSVKAAFNIISREESHRGVHDKKSLTESSAFFSNTGKPKMVNNNSKPECKKCGRTGHTIEKCFEIIGYPPRPNNLKCTKCGTTSLTLSNEQIAKLVNLLDGKSAPAHSSSNMTGNFMNLNVVFNQNIDKFLSCNINEKENVNFGWIIDSGANQHMTNSCKGFEVVNDVSNLNLTVGHPNGTRAKVKQIGNLRISKDLVLYDVLVVPDYCDLVTRKTVVTSSLYDGLYIFSDSTKGECHHSNLPLCMLSKSTWHSRLGH